MQNKLDVVRAVASQYPATLTHEQCALICNEVAWRLSKEDPAWGLSAKPNGKNARLPNGILIAEDILHYRTPSEGNPHGTVIDILRSAPLKNDPIWSPTDYHDDPTGRPWLPPFDPASFGSPTQPVGPAPPAGPSLTEVNAKLDQLLAAVEGLALLTHNSRLTAEGVQRLEAALAAGVPLRLRAKLIGEVTGTVGGPKR